MTSRTLRKQLATTCRAVGLPGPRTRQRQHTWQAAAIAWVADYGCDEPSREWAGEYLDAAWRAADDDDGDLCERMLHGARTALRIGNDDAYREEMGGYEEASGLSAIVEATPREFCGPPEDSLVVYPISRDGPVMNEWMWSEGVGIDCSGWIVDDGTWREAFDRERNAIAAVHDWLTRERGHGRGLPYLDSAPMQMHREGLARDEQTDPSLLIELAGDPCADVCEAVIDNVNPPIEALLLLAEADDLVQSALARRKSLPRAVIAKLARCPHEHVVAALIMAGHVSPEVLDRLRDESEIRATVAEDIGYHEGQYDLDVLEVLARDLELVDEVLEAVSDELRVQLEMRLSRGARPAGTQGILRRTYTIERWVRWADEVHRFAEDFETCFGVYPNILMASPVTYARIDMAANKEHIRGPSGEHAVGHTPLSDFVGPGYALMFVVGEEFDVGQVALLWDADPDGGGEVPEEDNVVVDARFASA